MGRGRHQVSEMTSPGKSCGEHLEDENDSKGTDALSPALFYDTHQNNLIKIIFKIILLEIFKETWYYHKKMGRWKTWQ
jgi:hypothetical protein